ncbi:hypothetical protein [Janthinobacterium agaricidamnosum]|uniref:Uncharacterized protein n=1 Tax=Janthinobacterium agaricidamnosum NBRC 102515 = DSM 9628 TaxID=1349767 RepID=W0V4M7_9BURK|nr:hypothetical protein [Janthinobacterium agaricidamnosum]CDG82308.1 hypothetical protein GJA_1670 [Janthinobacterium agaricidamnosum NBRC 102515 = DSM 9628]
MKQSISNTAKSREAAASQVLRLLNELAELSGQPATNALAPVLELQFDDILTSTTFTDDFPRAALLISALLPATPAQTLPTSSASPLARSNCGWAIDAGSGRYLFWRRVAAHQVMDERLLLDAIMTTKDLAEAWYLRFSARPETSATAPRKHLA